MSIIIDVEKRYDADNDRLFLVYYSLPPGLNANRWGVSERSLPINIKTAINKPVIIYRKNPSNQFHTKQAGNFVHPLPQEASAELGRFLNETDYYQWQEKFAIGRVRNVDYRQDKGYAFTLEITDPESKEVLKSGKYKDGIPGWTSPQILTYPSKYPEEERSEIYDHWVISHVILTDQPAYGFDKAKLAGSCMGPEKECMIQTRSASKENLDFCIKQATMDLVESRSSQGSQPREESHTKMSTNETTPQSSNTIPNEVVVTKTFSEQNQKQEGEQQAPPAGSGIGQEGDAKERERDVQEAESTEPSTAAAATTTTAPAKTLEEANQIIKQLLAKEEMYKAQQKEHRNLSKRLEVLENERRYFQVANIVPRDIYRTDDAHNKEVLRVIGKGLDKDMGFLREHYTLMIQARAGKGAQEQLATIKAKSSSSSSQEVITNIVEQYQAHDASIEQQNLSSTIERELSLGRKMFGGPR